MIDSSAAGLARRWLSFAHTHATQLVPPSANELQHCHQRIQAGLVRCFGRTRRSQALCRIRPLHHGRFRWAVWHAATRLSLASGIFQLAMLIDSSYKVRLTVSVTVRAPFSNSALSRSLSPQAVTDHDTHAHILFDSHPHPIAIPPLSVRPGSTAALVNRQ